MNQNSYICRFISDHENWKDCFAAKNISIKESSSLVILNYGLESDFTDPVVQEARGIIVDTDSLDVVCWPFRKFGNFEEGYIDEIDWNTARVQEKIDGSIVKLWYNHKEDRWQWSTNSVINATDAHAMDGSVSFLDLIRRADNYKDIPYDILDMERTYIFELVALEKKVVIRYDFPYLYHIGTRSNITGQEYDDDIGIKKPIEYPLHSLQECIRSAEALNQNSENVEHEGFVVVDVNWHRIKVKSPEYIYAHRIAACRVFTKKRLLPMVRSNDGSLEKLIKTVPDAEVYVRYYQWQYAELKRDIGIAIAKARAMYEEYEHDRKAIAEYLKQEPLQAFCYKSLGNNLTTVQIMESMADSMVSRLIEEYKV